jgi:ketosteroid isomerase-like protein
MAEVAADASHPNAALIARFYAALDRHDAEATVACYAPDATFSDPAFPRLDADGVAAMWRMQAAKALAAWRAKGGPATGAQG